jgi:hypothetical protein
MLDPANSAFRFAAAALMLVPGLAAAAQRPGQGNR